MFKKFVERYPRLGDAWQLTAEEARNGPIDAKGTQLVKLGIAAGALREGAVHSAVRKAIAAGASREEAEHVVALCAPTLGFPATVAVFSWVVEELDKDAG
jgi:alkylhydroperoxidase/carboxymuconolactone decarboxylase family protein YurZ